jgi:excisionase family DNA binding protein
MSIASTELSDAERGGGLLESPRWADYNTFTVPEAAEILRISRWAAYEAVKNEELPVIWIGRRCIVPRRALEKMLEVGSANSAPKRPKAAAVGPAR